MPQFDWKRISQIITEVPPISDQQALDASYPAARGLWCAWQWVCALSSSIEDAVVVAHGPVGCASSLMLFGNSLGRPRPFRHVISTAMGTEEVILGGEEALEQTIRQVDRDYVPPLICIHTNCCSALNMDDAAGVVERLKGQVKARLFFVPSPGFATCWPGDVAKRYLPRYLELMESPEKLEKDAINVLGVRGSHPEFGLPFRRARSRNTPSNLTEQRRMIEALGLKVHRVLMGGNYEDVRTASQAFANVYDCPAWGYPLGLAMQERLETLHLPHGQSIGVEANVRWLTDLAKATRTQAAARRFINAEYAAMEDVWTKAKETAKGKVALISGAAEGGLEASHALGLARFAMELGMTPYLYNVQPLAIKSQDYVVEYFQGEGVDPLVLAGPYPHRQLVSDLAAAQSLGLNPGEAIFLPGCRMSLFSRPHHEPWTWEDNATPLNVHPSRDRGFAGAAGLAREMLAALGAAHRARRPTVYERLAASGPDERDVAKKGRAGVGSRSSS